MPKNNQSIFILCGVAVAATTFLLLSQTRSKKGKNNTSKSEATASNSVPEERESSSPTTPPVETTMTTREPSNPSQDENLEETNKDELNTEALSETTATLRKTEEKYSKMIAPSPKNEEAQCDTNEVFPSDIITSQPEIEETNSDTIPAPPKDEDAPSETLSITFLPVLS